MDGANIQEDDGELDAFFRGEMPTEHTEEMMEFMDLETTKNGRIFYLESLNRFMD